MVNKMDESKIRFIGRLSKPLLETIGQPVGPITISYPFSKFGDNVTRLFKRTYWYSARHYKPQALSERMDDITATKLNIPSASAYLVSQGDPQVLEIQGLVSVEKEFATLPKGYIERMPTAFTMPGFTHNYSGSTPSYANFNRVIIPVTGGFRVGLTGLPTDWDGYRVQFVIEYQDRLGSGWAPTRQFNSTAIYSNGFLPTPFALGIFERLENGQSRLITQNSFVRNILRDPVNGLFDGFARHDFYLQKSADENFQEFFSMPQQFPADFILTGTSIPTSDEYFAMIQSAKAFQSRPCAATIWKGNIVHVVTYYTYPA